MLPSVLLLQFHREYRAVKESKVRQALQVFKALKDLKAIQVSQVLKDPRDSKVHKAIQAQPIP